MNYTNITNNNALNYIEVSLYPQPFSEAVADILASMIAPLGYDSFTTEELCLKAYCLSDKFSADALNLCISEFPLNGVNIKWTSQTVETEDWNAQWEESVCFEPIVIDDICCIHSPLATDIPNCKYDIVIAPKMSFGSGHHETTAQLLEEIIDYFENRKVSETHVLDMGTGTGILAILCGKLGAKVRAIEIDPWVAENATDNVLYNNLAGIVNVECGDASLLGDGNKYDLILANINRNVLLNDMHTYVADMNTNGTLLMSGFYEEDLPLIKDCAKSLGLGYNCHHSRNNWVVAKFLKK